MKSGDQLIAERMKIKEKTEKKSTSKKDDSVIYTSFLQTPDHILEQVKNAGRAGLAVCSIENENYEFIAFNKKTGTTERVKHFEFQGKTYYPVIDNIAKKNGVSLASDVCEYKDTAEIINQIREFFHHYIELPEFYEKFLPHLILFYWLYEKFPFVPYLQFGGRTATGKTTAMEVFGSICYKAIDTTGSMTIASIFRVATIWKGTLLIDEFEKAGDNAQEMISFLKSGVSDKLLLRTEGEGKKEVEAYIVKAPKVFTSENPINDAGLQSRTMVIKMEKNKRKIPLYRLPHYDDEAQEIRNKLLLWRLRNYNSIDLTKIEFGFPELEVFDRRVQQVVSPIFYFSDEATRQNIVNFAKEQEEETTRERRESLHGIIFESIYNQYVSEGSATIGQISKEINNPGNKYPVSEKKIANVIRKTLGFDTQRVGHDKILNVIFEEQQDKIDELVKYYGLSPSETPTASPASPANTADEAEKIFNDETETIPF
jgi:hypothetical protein